MLHAQSRDTAGPYLIGCTTIGAGLLLLTGVSPGYLTGLLPGLALTGAGLPFIWMTSEIVALSGVTRQDAGLATGVVQSAGQIGTAIGLAIVVTVTATQRQLARRPRRPTASDASSSSPRPSSYLLCSTR
jgi:hypothetical protein